MAELKAHPAAEAFPLLEGDEFKALVEDIKANGLVHSIVLLGKQILDGRNRYRACKAARVKPVFKQYSGKDPVSYVISTNLKRRHLDESQRALCAARLETPKHGGDRRSDQDANLHLDRAAIAKAFSVSERSVAHGRTVLDAGASGLIAAVDQGKIAVSAAAEIAALPKSEQRTVVGRVKRGEISGAHAKTEVVRATTKAKLEDISAKKAKKIEGVFDVLVIDAPWDMKKIERDVRPNQVKALDYPPMTESELANVKKWYGRDGLPCAKDAHVWVWTTHKFLPTALRLLDVWGLAYVCTFVWHKPGGFQPIGLPQYNCEFAIYARRGSPKFVDTKRFSTCFEAPRGAHSEKPEVFYDTVRRVTAGRRLDVFNRRAIRGFEVWGNEVGEKGKKRG